MIKCNLKTVRNHVRNHEAFDCNGTLTGDWSKNKPLTGWMRDINTIKGFDSMFLGGDDVFIVKSYDTPIAAWNRNDGWWINPEKYTVTTSRHMSAIQL